MGIIDKLQSLDDRFVAFARIGPTLPKSPPPAQSPKGPVRRYLAALDRADSRRAPDPEARRLFTYLTIPIWCLVIGLNSEIAADTDFNLDWIMIGVLVAVALTQLSLLPHRVRHAVTRAEAIYGPDWRTTTVAQRRQRWAAYIGLPVQGASVANPYAAIADPYAPPGW